MSKYRRKIKTVLIAFVVASVCASCQSSSSSNSSSSDSKKTVSGVVSDPEIKDAKVGLYRDGTIQPFLDSNNRNANLVTTDENGRFSFKISASTDISGYVIKSTGGFDTVTGESLEGVELTAPLEMFGNPNHPVISPLTSLVADEMRNGFSSGDAKNIVNSYLGFPAGTDLTVNPTSQSSLLEKSVLITKLVKKLKDNGTQTPIRTLRNALRNNPLVVAGDQINGKLLDEVITDEDQQEDIKEDFEALKEQLKTPGDFARTSYARSMFKTVRSVYMTQNSVSRKAFNEDGDKDELVASFKIVAAKITAAMTEKIGTAKQEKAVVYVLQGISTAAPEKTYKKETFIATDTLTENLDTFLTLDETKKQLAAIAAFASTTKYIVSIPLTPVQLLGNDNAKRVEYYYNSNIANTYFEQKVLENVYDDRVTDPVYSSLACTWAEAGDFDKAKAYIKNNIFQNDEKISAHKCVGAAYGNHGQYQKGIEQVQIAEDLFKKRVQAIGLDSVTANESNETISLAMYYYQLNDFEKAKAILDYNKDTLIDNFPTPTNFGRLAVKYRELVDRFIGKKDTAELKEIIDSALAVSRKCPASSGGLYVTRLYLLSDVLSLYAKIGSEEDVNDVLGQKTDTGRTTIYGLLKDDKTKSSPQVNGFLVNVTKDLMVVNNQSTAKDIVNRISSAYLQKSAHFWIGVYKAVHGTVDEGWNYFKTMKSSDSTVTMYLTFSDVDRKTKYLGALLVDAWKSAADSEKAAAKAKAIENLDKSITFLDEYRDSPAPKLAFHCRVMAESGYRNVGMLYDELGERAKAITSYQRAEALYKDESKMGLKAIGSPAPYLYTVPGLVKLAKLYRSFDVDKSNSLIEDAAALLESPAYEPRYLNRKAELAVSSNSAWKTRSYYGNEYKASIAANPFDSYLAYGFKDKAVALADVASTATQAMPETSEREQKIKVTRLLDVAFAYTRLKDNVKVNELLSRATKVVALVAAPDVRITYQQKVAAAYAKAFMYDKAVAVANAITTTGNRNKAFEAIANAYKNVNLFPGTYVARIDTDGDGKPDFFNTYATEQDKIESGLELDDDIDGDGVLDTDDTTPYFSVL